MTKAEALAVFDGNAAALARALKLRSRQAIYMWPDERIPERHELRLRHEIIPAMQAQPQQQAAG